MERARRSKTTATILAFAPIVIAVALLASAAIGRVLSKVWHAGATLDDAYIHFQYARAIAEGHPFRYQAGAPATSGATSFAWPAALAPFWLAGFRGGSIVWVAWTLSFVALGALSHEARLMTRGLAGEAAGLGAAAMVLSFSGFTWFAASGMEVVPFAWVLARCARRASEWSEQKSAERTRSGAIELVCLAIAAPFVRPEGALASIALALVLLRAPIEPARLSSRAWVARGVPIAALLAVTLPSLVLLVATGDARSTTAIAKLLPGNPYYRGPALWGQIASQARFLLGSILDGGPYSSEFVPTGGAPVACAGLVAIAACGWRTKKMTRATLVIGIALLMLAPCAYVTFLWNRLRYLWPFATGWIVGLACLARLASDAVGRLWPRARVVGSIACGAVVGMFLARMDGALDDVAQSASGIDRQQVALGQWVRSELPAEALVGVNDTGAIAYFGDHRTFDIVGLTTRGEARYWVAGAASRLEHYERLRARDASALPTHFVVYPEWFGCDFLLGAPLRDATVLDSTILGGQTMRAFVADYSLLGSGEAPWSTRGNVLDALDVADLESEEAHDYALFDAHDGDEVAGFAPCDCEDARPMVDGGRTHRTREAFTAHLPQGRAARLVARVESAVSGSASITVDGRALGTRPLEPHGWTEITFDIPADAARERTHLELSVDRTDLSVFHYWIVAAEGSTALAPAVSPPD